MATNNIMPLDQLASDLIGAVESMVERIQTTEERPASAFANDDRNNYLYVLYSQQGIPLKAGVVTGAGSKREANALQNEIQKMASSGLVRSFRLLELGSERLSIQVGKWFSSLFGSMLPLAGLSESTEGRPMPNSNGSGPNQPKRRGRPAGSKGKRGRKPGRKADTQASGGTEPTTGTKRRGRAARHSTIDSAGSESATPSKRRGRPRKTKASGAATKGRRGRPRKVESVTEPTETPKRRARKPGAGETSERTKTQKSRTGRPRSKDSGVQNGSAKPKRGRAGKASASSEAPKRRGRPRRSEVAMPTE